jgi:nucleoside triphosphate diphosphatase
MTKNQGDRESIEKLLDIMARLRARDGGCPWDLEQTFATIAPYTIEEAYEVADAIERGALDELRDELGDLLFQVVFHARMAEEAGAFDFAAVVAGICAKMLRRHPHVFGDQLVADSAAQTQRWEEIKRAEREADGDASLLAGVPLGLPALSRAAKFGRRAATVGFDWPDAKGVRDKVDEELAELDAALAAGDGHATAAEMGDLLFTIANWCRRLGLDPEQCARSANERFSRRFRAVEAEIAAAGARFADYDERGLDALWQRAKATEG